MKAVVQDLKKGDVLVQDLPTPRLRPEGVLVRTRRSLISLGTERAVMSLARKGPIGKARDRPDLARKVLNKAKHEGYWGTYQVVRNLISSPIPLGYSCAGEVIAVGSDAREFSVGDRVACAGLNFANHAEVNYVPRNLCVRIPEGLEYEPASFVTVGVIALHGSRLAKIELGHVVVVLGLGLVGQIAAQLARAAGATVVASDLDAAKMSLAARLGAHATAHPRDLKAVVDGLTGGHGADSVLVCAATKSSAPMRQAVSICRLKGRVVQVGDVGLDMKRRPMFQKEVEVVVSRSYGPGRYDPDYEVRGIDYPLPYVRWTERRNMGAFLDLVARGAIDLGALVTHRFEIESAEDAYRAVSGDDERPPIGIVLEYPGAIGVPDRIDIRSSGQVRKKHASELRVGVIGAGTFAKGVLLPQFARQRGVRLEAVCTGSGITARHVAEQFGARYAAGDPNEILDDPDIDAVVIATRHDAHADLTGRALAAGKAVFVEKPLALSEAELARLVDTIRSVDDPRLMVGFNRRFAPLAWECRDLFEPRSGPLFASYRVNAGAVEPGSWVVDPVEGGGRIIGEGCHFVDLLCFVTGSLPRRVSASRVGAHRERDLDPDGVTVTLEMTDGSVGVLHYLANGDPSLPKETCEIFGQGRVAVLDNYRTARLHSDNRVRKRRLRSQAKGHAEEVDAFAKALRRGEPMPIAIDELVTVTQTTFLIHESLQTGAPVPYRPPRVVAEP